MPNQKSTLPEEREVLKALSQLDFLNVPPVEPLLPCDAYPARGLGAGLLSFGFMMARDRYVSEYGFVLLTRECVDALAELLAGKAVLEVGAGTGFLAHCLAEKGINVVAQDQASPGEASTYFFQKKWKLDHIGPFQDTLSTLYGAVVMTWPCMGTSFAFDVATRMARGQLLIYEGEGPGGCTASGAFFNYVRGPDWAVEEQATYLLNQHHRQFPAIHDRWMVFKKL